MMMEKPAISELLNINDQHITLNDRVMLRKETHVCVGPNTILLYVGIDDGDNTWRKRGYSEQLVKIRRWAMDTLKVAYIKFTPNGPCYNELELFFG